MAGSATVSAALGPPSGRGLPPGPKKLSPFRLERARLQRGLRPLPLLLLVTWLIQRTDGAAEVARVETDLNRAVALALAEQGLHAEPSDVHFVSDEHTLARSPVGRPRALVRAERGSDPADIYLVETRVSPEGHLIELTNVYDISDTSAADERELIVRGDRAAWIIGQENAISSVQYADLRGEPRPTGRGWNALSRAQNALTNLQDTGQTAGIGRRSFKFDPPAYKVVLGFSDAALSIDADGHRARVETDPPRPLSGDAHVIEQTASKARPGNLVTWAVDRMRNAPWFGDDRMQWLKAVAFDGLDHFERLMGSVTGDDGSDNVKAELGGMAPASTTTPTDPETGWPPAPMQPLLDPPLPGEGKWASLEKDPFVGKAEGLPCPFVFSFIRSDKARIYSQVFVTLWDPRQVELHAMSGTVEPRSATGETGSGLVPRKPEVMGRYVAAFNGGFQAVHGEFGMMADKVLYLPPKPYGATVAELSDGSTSFGTWPEQDKVPDDVVSFRQNMTALIQDEAINPYKRHWWGGLPPGWTEEARTVRSGLCMTKEGFIGYFYGSSIDPDVLALAMRQARCTYGIHLDMNPGHTGLEFYRAGPAGTLPALSKPLDEVWEARGALPGMNNWEFMGRRMIRLMALMNFPRYVNAEARDFFYLTLRPLLPGPAIASGAGARGDDGKWRVLGLPQQGFPYAVATTTLGLGAPDARVTLARLDPKLLRVVQANPAGGADEKGVLELRAPLAEGIGDAGLYHDAATGQFVIADTEPSNATHVTRGFSDREPAWEHATSALGVDADGMLVYVAPSAGAHVSAEQLRALLQRLRCERSLFFLRPLGVVLGDVWSGNDASDARAGSGVWLARAQGPGARQLFPDTPVVLPSRWAPLQQKRVRYR